jgi:putative ABC transport system permease protein
MTRIPGLRRFMRVDRDRAGVDRAVDDEIGFHFDMTLKELRAAGMSEEDARREAVRRFGDVERTRARLATIDRTRVDRERRTEWWGAFSQDLRYAVRGIRLKPGFALGVVLTLGLGIGANAAMFGIVDRLLFRPPAFLNTPERMHRIYFRRMVDGKEFVGGSAQYQRLVDLARDSKSMDLLAGYAQGAPAVGVGEGAREREIGAMSASMWQMFAAHPALGRFFSAGEDQYPNISRVVVLSYGYWQSQYGGARDVLGKQINIGPSLYTVIGVAPRGFAAVEIATPTMFVPLTAWAVDGFGPTMWAKYYNTYNITWIKIYGRRRPGVTVEAAAADLTLAYRRSYEHQISAQPRSPSLEVVRPQAVVASVLEERGPSRSADANVATLLLGVACIVLLIACANVGNLLLGRALKRRREIAVRLALGVSRTRLTVQLVVESVLLAVIGGVAGVAVAQWGGAVVRATLLPQVDWGNALADTRVLAFTGVAALTTGLLTGLAPIVQAGQYNVASELKAGPREGGGHRSRMRTTLIVFQAALSVVLLVGAGLFVRSIQRIRTVDLGYDPDRILWVEPHLRGVKLDSARKAALNQELVDRARRQPGVENGTIVLSVPFSASYNDDVFVPGVDTAKVRSLGEILLQSGSPGYFATMGTRILSGRAFSDADRTGTMLVAIVSDALARALWPGENAIGKCVKISADTMPCRTVVGISENVRFGRLRGESPSLVLHVPATQFNANSGTIFIRTHGDADSQRETLRRALQPVMPGAGYVSTSPLSNVLERVTRSWRLGAALFTVFGGLALILAAIGLYSVIAYGVTQRTHEMGVRIALGAQASEVVAMIVRDGLRVVAIGFLLGGAIAVAAGHWIAPLLFDVSPRDPLVYALVAVTLAAVALAAGWLPARRAARVDPATALRTD